MSKGLVSIVIFLSIIVVGVVAVWPAYQIMRESLGALKLKETELETKGAYYDNVALLYKESKEYAGELAKINSALPEKNSTASLFQFIQQIGSENGMALKDIGAFSTNPSADSLRIKEVEFDFTILGNYSSFRNFLEALEKSSRLIDVRNISIPQEKSSTVSGDSEIATGELSQKSETGVFPFNIKVTTHSY
ncbi:MAG: type 4a pilus biogenesis protein PilO [bacterium]